MQSLESKLRQLGITWACTFNSHEISAKICCFFVLTKDIHVFSSSGVFFFFGTASLHWCLLSGRPSGGDVPTPKNQTGRNWTKAQTKTLGVRFWTTRITYTLNSTIPPKHHSSTVDLPRTWSNLIYLLLVNMVQCRKCWQKLDFFRKDLSVR